MRHFLAIEDYSQTEIQAMLDLAKELKRYRYQDLLNKRSMVSMFFNPSTRTRTSMELAISQLGGHHITLEPGKSSWGIEVNDGIVMLGDAEEHMREVAGVLSRYVDIIGIRCFPTFKDWSYDRQDPVIKSLARHSSVPVVNLETISHPCQALAMMQTIQEKTDTQKNKNFTLTWVYHPRGLNTAVANSAGVMASLMGMNITIAHPPGYDLDERYISYMKNQCHSQGTRFRITHNMDEAMEGAHFVYAKSWGSLQQYGNFQADIHQQYQYWIVNSARMKKTDNGYFSHCLPLRRNVKATDEVLDSPQSLVIDEAENRLHVQKAVLVTLERERHHD